MDDRLNLTTEQHALNWNNLFQVLSLDAALPYWKAMNLVLDEDQKPLVQKTAREACLRGRSLPLQADSIRKYINSTENIRKFFFEKLEFRGAVSASNEIKAWAVFDFVGTTIDQTVESNWVFGLLDLRNEFPTPEIELKLDANRYRILVEKIESEIVCRINSRKRLFESIELKTEWDRDQFRRYLFSTGKFQGEYLDVRSGMSLKDFYPLNCVEMTIERSFVRTFWADIVAEFTKAELCSLQNWFEIKLSGAPASNRNLQLMPRLPRLHNT